MIQWSIPPGPWWLRPESDRNVVETISVRIPPNHGEIVQVSHVMTADDLPDQVVVASDLTGTTLTAPTLLGLFPILEIWFLRDGALGVAADFDDVPDEAENIISYRKLIGEPRRYDITVTVLWQERDNTQRQTESRAFYFIVVPDYTPGRDRLVEEVNARRR